ncbi:hypothetical protein TNCV_4852981 [Trichonephila clavipes]|nr:hypothetical protein TNCV_4852981 [Trichonephila clavipes]
MEVTIKKRFNRFRSDRTSVEGNQHSGRSQAVQNAAVIENGKNLVMEDSHLTVRETAKQVQISTRPPHVILCNHAQSGYKFCSQGSVSGTGNAPSCSCIGPTGHH